MTENPSSYEYPIFKFGARWILDGPRGRSHHKTKGDAEAALAGDLALPATCKNCRVGVRWVSHEWLHDSNDAPSCENDYDGDPLPDTTWADPTDFDDSEGTRHGSG